MDRNRNMTRPSGEGVDDAKEAFIEITAEYCRIGPFTFDDAHIQAARNGPFGIAPRPLQAPRQCRAEMPRSDTLPAVDRSTFIWAIVLLPLIALTRLRGGALIGLRKVVLGMLPDNGIRAVLFLGFIVAWYWQWPFNSALPWHFRWRPRLSLSWRGRRF